MDTIDMSMGSFFKAIKTKLRAKGIITQYDSALDIASCVLTSQEMKERRNSDKHFAIEEVASNVEFQMLFLDRVIITTRQEKEIEVMLGSEDVSLDDFSRRQTFAKIVLTYERLRKTMPSRRGVPQLSAKRPVPSPIFAVEYWRFVIAQMLLEYKEAPTHFLTTIKRYMKTIACDPKTCQQCIEQNTSNVSVSFGPETKANNFDPMPNCLKAEKFYPKNLAEEVRRIYKHLKKTKEADFKKRKLSDIDADREIFNDPGIQRWLKEGPQSFKEIMTFSKYRPFVVEANERYLLGLIDGIKELMDFEEEKAKGPKKQGKKGGKAPAKVCDQTTSFINTCHEVLKALDIFNNEKMLADHRFQLFVRPALSEGLELVFDDARVSPSIWKSRINQMEKVKKNAGANPFLTMVANISIICRQQKTPRDWFLPDALVTKAVPLTASQDARLKELRKIHQEKSRSCNILEEKEEVISFYQFVDHIVTRFGSQAPEDPEDLNKAVFSNDDFQTMMVYKDFRHYVFRHPHFSHLCQKFNEKQVDMMIRLINLNLIPEDKQRSPKDIKHGPLYLTAAQKKSLVSGKKWNCRVKKHLQKLEKFKAETELKDPDFILKLDRVVRKLKSRLKVTDSEAGLLQIYRRDKRSDELRSKTKIDMFVSRQERANFKRRWGPEAVKEQLENMCNRKKCMSLAKFALTCAPEFQTEDRKQFWNNANLALIKIMVRKGAVLFSKDGKQIELTGLKLNKANRK